MLQIAENALSNILSPDYVAQPTTVELIEQWEDLKRAEAQANAARLEVEAQLAQRLAAPEEGSKTHRFGEIKVVRENAFYYGGNVEKLQQFCGELEINPPLKLVVDDAAVKRMYKGERGTFDLLAGYDAVTRKAAKVSFTISRQV